MAMAYCSSMMSFLFVILMGFLCTSHAYIFLVGGDDGWIIKPSEKYSTWAKRNRFQINDSLVFKFEKGHDSVLIVNKNDYKNCNKDNPKQILKDGDSTFKFNKSGSFYFISGHEQNCEKGQKFIIVVLSEHHQNSGGATPSHPPSTSHAPPAKPPSHSPSPSPTPKHAPLPPSHSPTPSPSTTNQAPAPSPRASHAPLPTSHSPSPSKTPSHAPHFQSPSSPKLPHKAPTPSPTTHHPPSPSPKAESPKNNNIAPERHQHAPPLLVYFPVFTPHQAPAPAPSAAPDVGVSFVVVIGFSLMVSTLILAGFV